MNDLEGYNLYYVINKNQRGFSKIIGGMVVDQCELLNRENKLFDNYHQTEACFFQTEEEAESFKKWLEKKGLPGLEVRFFEVPYGEVNE
jgi:hypothetical protein